MTERRRKWLTAVRLCDIRKGEGAALDKRPLQSPCAIGWAITPWAFYHPQILLRQGWFLQTGLYNSFWGNVFQFLSLGSNMKLPRSSRVAWSKHAEQLERFASVAWPRTMQLKAICPCFEWAGQFGFRCPFLPEAYTVARVSLWMKLRNCLVVRPEVTLRNKAK